MPFATRGSRYCPGEDAKRKPSHQTEGGYPGGILGTRVDGVTYSNAAQTIAEWTQHAESRYVCVVNVHMVMEAYDDPSFRAVVDGADLVTPDGISPVWVLRRKGFPLKNLVYGLRLMLHVPKAAEPVIATFGQVFLILGRQCRGWFQQRANG